MRAQAFVGDPLLRRSPAPAGADAGVVEALYREHRSRLVHLAAAITLDRAEAEEVVQEAFAGLQQRADAVLDPVGTIVSGVTRIGLGVGLRLRPARAPVRGRSPEAGDA